MSDDRPSFFSRWSQRKVQARTEPVPPEPPALPTAPAEVAPPRISAPVTAEKPTVPSGPPSPTLADVAELSHASDYSRFVAPGVDSNVRNAAMKKLFTDPHFNVMDGLDIYIDDYGKADPIPPEILRQMVQSQVLGLFDEEEKDQAPAAAASVAGEAPAPDAATGNGGTVELPMATAPAGEPLPSAEAADAAGRLPACGFVAAARSEGAADNLQHDHDAHLQLQSDDAARWAGIDQGARPREV